MEISRTFSQMTGSKVYLKSECLQKTGSFKVRGAYAKISMLPREKKKKGVVMCYNYGCEMPDNYMGNPKNITNKTFEEAAKASGKKPEEAKKNALDLLEKNLGIKNKNFQTQKTS